MPKGNSSEHTGHLGPLGVSRAQPLQPGRARVAQAASRPRKDSVPVGVRHTCLDTTLFVPLPGAQTQRPCLKPWRNSANCLQTGDRGGQRPGAVTPQVGTPAPPRRGWAVAPAPLSKPVSWCVKRGN